MFASPSAVKLREYERIFTGSNQEFGYENPILDFIGNTTLQIFSVDKTTYFHYPITAPSGLLIDSDLVNAGAVAGGSPYRSDKIWKKMADYSTTSIWGDSQPIGKQTGVWLCAWLSGDMATPSAAGVWLDRWFNPGYIDATTAMFINNPASAVIVDIPSEMILEGGCWYRYYHVGNLQNETIVNTLTGSGQNLKLWIEDWKQFPIDLSPYNNTAQIENYTSDSVSYAGINIVERPKDSCLNLNGVNQHCQVLYNSSYALSGDLTYSIWAYANDWNNVQGNHILSKDYRGGWSLKYNNGFFTPIVYVADRATGNILFLNSDGKELVSKPLPGAPNPVAAVVDNNLFTWVLDNGTFNSAKHLYKIDYNGDIRNAVNFGISETLKNLTIDQNNMLWVLGNSTVSAFDNFSLNILTACAVLSTYNYIDVGLSGELIGSQNSFVIDNSGNTIIASTSSDVFAYQKDDYIWVLNGANNFYKKNLNGTLVLSGVVGASTDLSGRSIAFTNEFVNTQYKDYVWMLQEADQFVYKYDTDGNMVKRVDVSKYDINPYILGDFTGYQKNRKFDYLKHSSLPQVQTEIFLNQSPLSGSRYTLSIPVSNISNNDWHMFTFTFNQTAINLYMDSILRAYQPISYNAYIYYEYENPLILGANAGKIVSLDEELDLEKLHFNGRLDDLRIYNIELNNSDIRHIYLNKFDYHDLKWNMPTGEQSYLEEIERFFKFKLPGLKSQYYNIKLIGLQITDVTTRNLIEDIIKNTIKKAAPAYAELFKIIWE